MVCAQTSAFWYTESWNFQNSQLRMRINTKPNGKQNWSGNREKWHFCWLVTSLPMYLKSRVLRTDHKRAKKIETLTTTSLSSLSQNTVYDTNIWQVTQRSRATLYACFLPCLIQLFFEKFLREIRNSIEIFRKMIELNKAENRRTK